MRRLLESDFSDLPVLSYQELAADVRVQPVGQLGSTRPTHAAPPGIGFDATAAGASA